MLIDNATAAGADVGADEQVDDNNVLAANNNQPQPLTSLDHFDKVSNQPVCVPTLLCVAARKCSYIKYIKCTKRFQQQQSVVSSTSSSSVAAGLCSGCGCMINDRVVLSTNERFWHVDCLRCHSCAVTLEQFNKCYVKNDNAYCSQCYCGYVRTF